ncbi:ATP-binding protein [Algoriphagus namhaensis]|uniref:histidine kinase n=1 Tax=Algoriphagus namhaensis TaxID=915353 RepID=A0ABV8AP67_9BACT
MKSNFLKYILASSFLSLAFLCEEAFAQINASKGVPSFTNYVVGDLGVAGQQVWNVGQDKDGFIYLGTSSGLQRFDGVNWKILSSPIQDFNTTVRATYLASDGTFYYGSIGDFGYATKDSLGNTILKSVIADLPEEFLFNDVWTIREVNGDIYFQTRQAIFIYTPGNEEATGRIRIWKPDTVFMYGFALDGVYYAHQMDLGIFREKNGALELIPGSEFLGSDRVQTLLPYKKSGNFLIGAFGGGLFLFDGENFEPFKTEIDEYFKDGALYKSLALPDGNYALSVLGYGFFIIDQNGKALAQFNTNNSITDQSVYAFYLDNTQNLWVGTNAGVSKIELFSPVMRFDSEEYEVGNVLSLNGLDDRLYIGGSTKVLFIDKGDGAIKRVNGLPNNQYFDLVLDEDKIISSGLGIYEIRGDKSNQIKVTESFQNLKILISKKYPGYIFITGQFGIHVFKRTQNSTGTYVYSDIGPIPQVERAIYSIIEDKEGEIWGGTQSGVLYRVQIPKTASGNLDVANSGVTEYNDEDGVQGISGTVVNVQGNPYTSGINGFYYFDHNTQSFIRDEVFSFSEEVADINLDGYGLGSNQYGDVTLDFKGEKRLAKPQEDGSYILQEYPYNLITASFTGSWYTEPSGVFWFGTDEGLLRVDPNTSYKTDYPTPLYFTSVTSNEKQLTSPEYHGEAYPELEYKGNKIRFGYVAPFFVKENQIEYQTFLEGFEEDWSEWETNTFREFTNLPYGEYSFKVRAKNTFDTISDEIAYSFVILPPWYATWWAFVLYFFAFGLIVYGVVKFQTGRVLAREKAKTQERELAQAKEIEKAYKDLKATQAQLIQSEKMASLGELTAGIAHEIQNPLNFVNNFADLNQELIDELEEEIEKGNLAEIKEIAKTIKENEAKIKQHGRRADLIVKGMLQHSRANSGERNEIDLNSLAEEFLKLSYHGLRAKDKSFNADFNLDLDPAIPKIKVVEQDIGRVVLNLINNAFYAINSRAKSNGADGYKPMVSVHSRLIQLGDQPSGIELSIEDNGGGIPKAIKNKIFQPFFTTKPTGSGTGLGLSLSYDIIKAHGGDLRVKSKEGEGTEMIIFLPIEP